MIQFRYASQDDIHLLFRWANDELVRENSFNTDAINIKEHTLWFEAILNSKTDLIYIFTNENLDPIGNVRIYNSNDEIIIGIAIDQNFRGRSFGAIMLTLATKDYFKQKKNKQISAYIKKTNLPSLNIFLKAGFKFEKNISIHGNECVKTVLVNED
ncbi:MAG: GNAT family N-acetyltransferase [Bacteroidia bacterium]|nr:GNAT family N-acetyltransferase [Bacteroidia bacterium]